MLTSTTSVTICSNQLPYSWNGKAYIASGTYNDTLSSASSCDSIATLELIINPILTSTSSVTICTNQLPHSWNGKTYTAAGTYNDTLTSASGCDSIATLELSVSPILTSTMNVTICTSQLPYSWNGKTYTTAGTYSDTLTSASGCDSIATLQLNVTPIETSLANVTICSNQLPYIWNRKTYSNSGIYIDTLASVSGCDSIATLELTVSPTPTSSTSVSICSNQLPYAWNSKIYSAAGTYSDTLTSVSGCDSISTLALTVSPMLTSTTTKTICSSQLPYAWNNNKYSIAGIYRDTLKSASGCDSIATLELTVSPILTTTVAAAICANQLPYVWNNRSFSAAGVYSDTLRSISGCDSIATLELTVNPIRTSTAAISICSNQLPYGWNGKTYTETGTYSDTLTGSSGCDSIARLVLTVKPVLNSTTNITICPNQLPYTWNGNAYSAAGTYSITLASISGCDSIATLILTINAVSTSTTNKTICSNQLPYRWNGNSYDTDGTYKIKLSSASGCDSIATLELTVSSTLTSTVNQIICSNQQIFRWNRKVYTQSGVYIDTLKTSAGCDSVVTLNLTVTPAITENQNIVVCAQSYTLPNGTVVSSSGVYTSVMASASGCDKTVITNLTLQQAPTIVINNPAAVCAQSTVDLTAATVTAGSDPGLTYHYWTNSSATAPLGNPNTVAIGGTYYISATTSGGCTTIKPVTATISASPQLMVTNPATVCAPATVDLTAAGITAGSDPLLTFTYWRDAAATIPLDGPKAIATSGSYYIKASTGSGCSIIKPQQVKVTITKPIQSIRYPFVTARKNTPLELQARYFSSSSTYKWEPPLGLNSTTERTPTFNYNKDVEFIIKVTSVAGCLTVDTLVVRVQDNPSQLRSDIFVPKAWTPNGDGQNDKLTPLPVNIRTLNYFRIFNRWGQLVFETNQLGIGWDGVFNGKPQVTDTYTWMIDAIGLDDRHFNFTGNSILIR